MATNKPRHLIRIEYEEAAQAYLRSLPPEHFMEATAQGTQRKITLESFDLVHARRPDVQVFNELLVQYPEARSGKPRQVVPDNMVVVWHEPIIASGSYDLPLQPTGPFCVLECVSKYNQRKDYDQSFHKYERYLKVPYFLLFYPDAADLTLFHHTGRRYAAVKPNERERLEITELELEVALLDEWVRFWHQGELLPLPADLLRELEDTRKKLKEMTRQAKALHLRAEEQTQRAEEQTRRAEEEHQARLAADQEIARLRARLATLAGNRANQ